MSTFSIDEEARKIEIELNAFVAELEESFRQRMAARQASFHAEIAKLDARINESKRLLEEARNQVKSAATNDNGREPNRKPKRSPPKPAPERRGLPRNLNVRSVAAMFESLGFPVPK